jgi:hypothetical protein
MLQMTNKIMNSLIIKSTLVFITTLLFFFCTNSKVKPQEIGKQTKSFQIRYNLTRTLISGDSSSTKQLVTNGMFYGSADYSINQNERITYIREKSSCLILSTIEPKVVMQLDTLNSITYLCSEPGNDIFLLIQLISTLKRSSERNYNNLNEFKYFIGNTSRNIDSVYLTYNAHNDYPDHIKYISKQIGETLATRSLIVDSLKITSLDTLPKKPKINTIEEYLNSDSIRKRRVLKLNSP